MPITRFSRLSSENGGVWFLILRTFSSAAKRGAGFHPPRGGDQERFLALPRTLLTLSGMRNSGMEQNLLQTKLKQRRSRPMDHANTVIRQEATRRSDRFYSTSTILHGVAFLVIAIAIAAGMVYLEAASLINRIAPYHWISRHLISYANIVLIVSTFLYVSHLWVTAKTVGQWATWTANIGAMGVTVALLIGWLESNHPQQIGHVPFSSLYAIVVLFTAATVVIYLAMEKVYHTRAAGAFVMPVVAAVVLFESTLLPDTQGMPGHLAPVLTSYWIHIHILSNVVGYGAFAVAASMGVMYLFRQRAERRVMSAGLAMRALPDLKRIDSLMYEVIVLGFLAYSLGAFLGATWSFGETSELRSWFGKNFGTLAVWSIYLAYFYGHHLRRWPGNRTAWLAIVGFGISVFFLANMNLFSTNKPAQHAMNNAHRIVINPIALIGPAQYTGMTQP